LRRRSRSRAEMRLQNKGGASPHTPFVRARNPPACHSPARTNDSIRSIVPTPRRSLWRSRSASRLSEPRPPDAHLCTRSPLSAVRMTAHCRGIAPVQGSLGSSRFAGLRGKISHQSLNTHTAHPHTNHTPFTQKQRPPYPKKAPHPLSSNSTFKNQKAFRQNLHIRR
jgi:hypothetical protein